MQRHGVFTQRRINIDVTSWRCIDVNVTLNKRNVPLGIFLNSCVNVMANEV